MNEEFKSVVKYRAINRLSINFSKTNYTSLILKVKWKYKCNYYSFKIFP